MSSLTFKDLDKALREVEQKLGPSPFPMRDPLALPSSLFDMRIVEAPRTPKMQLSADCPVTDDFRKEMNTWLVEFFGYKSIVPENTVYILAGGYAVMRPETAVRLSNIC